MSQNVFFLLVMSLLLKAHNTNFFYNKYNGRCMLRGSIDGKNYDLVIICVPYNSFHSTGYLSIIFTVIFCCICCLLVKSTNLVNGEMTHFVFYNEESHYNFKMLLFVVTRDTLWQGLRFFACEFCSPILKDHSRNRDLKLFQR